MIEIQVPNREIIIDVLDGLVVKRYSREEVVQWRSAVIKKYDYVGPGVLTVPLEIQDGYWEFVSFAVLAKRGVPEDNNDFFIREEDLIEYLNVLKQIDCTESNGEIKRIRPHQIKPSEINPSPLIEYVDVDRNTIRKAGVFFKRGIFENLGVYLETAHIKFSGVTFTIDFYHDQVKGHVFIEGVPENKEILSNLLCEIGVSSSSIKWVSELIDNETCELYRLDDNGNNISMGIHNSYIEAETMRYEFETKKHKQAYFLKRNLTK